MMKKLLKFEFHNMIRQKIVYVLVALMLIFLSLLNNTPAGRLEYYHSIGYGLEDMIVGALSSCSFSNFMAAIISFIVCRDYEQGVIKNIYGKGYSFKQVYSAKFIYALILTGALCLLTIVVGVIEAIMVFGSSKTDITMIMIAQFIAMLAYSAFGYMVCQIMKKTGFSIILLLLVPPLGGLLLDQIDFMIPFDFSFGDLWISQTMAYIHGGTITGKEITLSLITSFVYIVGCYFVGLKFSKKDIK